ncbi:MAG: hypothetical protein D8M57_09640 [Candidatus Scalindua sp. AMX11]|nr:MAG: hypothetical protein DWQ00_00990 [Candidatus Scalindua sp.]NOG82627.1 hypothetical protein [Planctomycetota bacterium]RZV78299.1 MAG: hypothetical protein EX341_11265 [Candidatus Scalindua sp. SCAELEC01]TDE65151.1 MAG: hypothetical protein D8M57_09640 [Candidatus Scalindua sp. AMX11]GJQ59497.1 MAG: hypothetical protein SCALA701_22980 [Candidatus Scalindua sp.]
MVSFKVYDAELQTVFLEKADGSYFMGWQIFGFIRMYPRRKRDGTWDGPGDKLNGLETKKLVENLYAKFWKELSLREKAE